MDILQHSLQKINNCNSFNHNGVTIFDNFLSDSFFSKLEKELIEAEEWKEDYWVLDKNDWVSNVNQNAFLSHSKDLQFSVNYTIRETDRNELTELKKFNNLLQEPVFVRNLSAMVDIPLKAVSPDVAKYGQGHFLARHADLFGGRCLAAVFFITTSPNIEYGANLIVENEEKEIEETIQPQKNRMVFFPIKKGFWHRVSRNVHPTWNRITVATHYIIS